jgi:hypothetical protein
MVIVRLGSHRRNDKENLVNRTTVQCTYQNHPENTAWKAMIMATWYSPSRGSQNPDGQVLCCTNCLQSMIERVTGDGYTLIIKPIEQATHRELVDMGVDGY